MGIPAKILHKSKRLLMRTRRHLYGLRTLVPGWRGHHQREAMVGPLGFWNELQRYQMHTLLTLGLQPEHSLLDIGCGPLQGGIPCIRFLGANRYTGVDILPDRVRAAFGQVSRHNLGSKNPRILLSDSFGDRELNAETFDFIWASQILCYFDDATMGRLLTFVTRRLKPGGKFLGDIFSPEHYEFKYPEFPGKYIRHTTGSFQLLAKQYGLDARCLGPLAGFQYPQRLSLRTSLLMEITRPGKLSGPEDPALPPQACDEHGKGQS
jgi:SAM-dependent methyltransferase